MKKITLSVALAMIALQSLADKRGVYISAQGSFGASKVVDCNYYEYNASLIGKTYTNEHVTAGYMFTPHFGVFAGVGINSYKYTIQVHTTQMHDYQDKYTYFQIPVYLRYVSSKNNKIGVSVEAGCEFDFLMKTEEKALFDKESWDIKHYITNRNVVLFCSPAIKIPISNRISLDVGPFFSASLKNAYNSEVPLTGTFTAIGGRANLNIRLTEPKKRSS